MSARIIQVPRPISRAPAQRPEKISKPVEPSTLPAEYLRSVLHYDPATGIFTWKVSTSNRINVGDVAGCPGGDGYLLIGIQSRLYRSHRLAWLYVYGTWPEDQIDHINRDRSDNRVANLREVTHKQNGQNRSKPSNNTSGHPGVYWHKQRSKWQARIKHNQKIINLGLFKSLEEALSARKAAEKLYWADTNLD